MKNRKEILKEFRPLIERGAKGSMEKQVKLFESSRKGRKILKKLSS